MHRPFKVLLIEDNPGDARLIQEVIREADEHEVTLEFANRLEIGLKRLEHNTLDCVLLDLGLPDSQGFDTFTRVRERAPHLPIIVLTGLSDVVLATRIFREGSSDYLIKGQVYGNLLLQTIRRNIQRNEGEKALRQSEERLRLTLEAAQIGTWEWDMVSNKVFWTGVTSQVFGIAVEAFGGTYEAALALVHPADRARVEDDVSRALAQDGHYTTEYRILRPNGTMGWVLARGQALYNDHHLPVRMLGVIQDITDRKRAEENLLEREDHIRLLLDSTAEAIYGIDLQGNATFCNRACLRLLGYSDGSELLGKNTHVLMHHKRPDGRFFPVEECRIFQAFRRGEGTHVEDEVFWRADGTSFPTEYWSYPIRRDEIVIGAVVTFIDITERKNLESQFRHSQQRLQHVVASSPAVLYTLEGEGPDLRITWISENVREMMGYSPAEVFQPKWWHERVHPEDLQRLLAEIQQQLFTQDRLAHEYRFRHRDGEHRWVRSEMRLLRDATGNPTEIVGSWSDITERKLLEDQFRQAQKMEAIGQLAAGVAHDFNNLLTIILGYSELLLCKLPPTDPNRQPMGQIRRAAERASDLTRQLLAFGRKQILAPVVLDINSLMSETEKMLRRLIGEDIELTTLLQSGLGRVKADPGQVEQVIMNLVVNARDAMPRGGRLTIRTTNAVLSESQTRQHPEVPPGPHTVLAVSDTGSGMDETTQARIFEPFFTTKEVGKGTGLGLATVFGIAKQSGGFIEVDSVLGSGSTFRIYLPQIPEETCLKAPDHGLVKIPKGMETILLVEDEDGLRDLAQLILEASDYKVLSTRDGSEALGVSQKYAGPIDMLFTDVVMPKMSGRQLAELLLPLRPKMKVLYMSGYTDDTMVRHGIRNAATNFLSKPFTPIALAQKVREVLDFTDEPPQTGVVH